MIRSRDISIRRMTTNDLSQVAKWLQDPYIYKFVPTILYYKPFNKNIIIDPSLQTLHIIIEHKHIPIAYARITEIDWLRRTCLLLFLIGQKKYRNNSYWFKSYVLLAYYIFEQLNLNYLIGIVFENNEVNNRLSKSFFKAKYVGTASCAHYIEGNEIGGNIYQFSKADYHSAKKEYIKYLDKYCPIEIPDFYK